MITIHCKSFSFAACASQTANMDQHGPTSQAWAFPITEMMISKLKMAMQTNTSDRKANQHL